MKAIYKGFKCTLSQMFVKEDREIEIGHPTDVKHVAHIGWDGASSSGSAPSWMNEFDSAPDFAATSIGTTGSALSQWSSQDLESTPEQSATDKSKDITPSDLPSTQRKQRRKKSRPRSGSSSSKSARAAKPNYEFIEGNANLTNIEVA